MKIRKRAFVAIMTVALLIGILSSNAFADEGVLASFGVGMTNTDSYDAQAAGDMETDSGETEVRSLSADVMADGNPDIAPATGAATDPQKVSDKDLAGNRDAEDFEKGKQNTTHTVSAGVNGHDTTPAVDQKVQSGDQKVPGEDSVDKDKKNEDEKKEQKKKEEGKKEEGKKENEKDRMPAQSFSGSAGGLSVRASAGLGVFPEGTVMHVSAVSSGYVMSAAEAIAGENGTVVDAKAVDITFTKDGSEIQPAAGSVNVSLSATGAVDGETHEAVHISTGSVSSMGDASATSASFRADHFSIYGIIGVDYDDENIQKQERHTYKFYVNNNLVDTQTVTDGDTLVQPQVPASVSGKVFREWQVTREDDTNIYPPYTLPFGIVDIPVGDHAWADKTFRVDAVFDETYFVTFYKDVEKTSVLRTKAAAKGAEITTNDVTFDFGNRKAITGWKESKNANATVGSIITVTGDIELIPVISDVNWVMFESNGGSPVAAVYSVDSSAVTAPTPPTRSGFSFAGWFRDPNLQLSYNFRNPVTEDITLYAKWDNAEKVQYTVAYWKQNANDDGYTFVESETGSDYAGEAAKYSGKDTKYEGFTLNRAKSDVDVIIKGNGTTIKNVYYDRKTYPLTFYIQKTGDAGMATWEKVAERAFGYQEDTSAFWHNVTQKYKNYGWFVSENSDTFYSCAPLMRPAEGALGGFKGINVYGRPADYSYTIRYLEEDINREIKEAFTGKTSQTNITFTDDAYIYIPGFTYSRKIDFNENREGTLYYKRNIYTLRLIANGGPAPEGGGEYRNIKFEESLAKYSPSNYKVGVTTAKFEGITKTFAGWYDNELLFGSPFSFMSTMPALETVKQTGDKETLALYAKWVTDEHTVTFDLNGGTINGASAIEPEIVEAGDTATQPAGDMKKDGFTFGGWAEPDGSLFRFDTIITADADLTAVWHADTNEEIGIVYNAGDKSDSEFTDNKKYHRNAEAVIKGVPEVKDEYRKQGYYFKGWRVGDSDTLVSRGTFAVIDPGTEGSDGKTLTLWAVYDRRETETTVSYHSNLPDGTDEIFTDPAPVNERHTVRTFSQTNMKGAGDDYEFIGWKTEAGKMLTGGETVAVGKGGETLTAQWKALPKVYVTISGNNREVEYDGEEQTSSGFDVRDISGVDGQSYPRGSVSVELKEDLEAKAIGTDTGTYFMGLEEDDFVIVPAAGYIVEGVIIEDGKLTIQPKEVTVKADDKNKLCGEKDPEFTAEVSGTVNQEDAEKISYSISREPGEAMGTYPISVSAQPLQGNYKVATEPGSLLIIAHHEPVVVNITGNKDSVTYDGREQYVSGYSIDVPGGWIYTEDDFTFSGKAEIKRTDAGTYFMGLDASQFSNTNHGFGNVRFNVTDGSLEITRKDVSVKADNKNKLCGDRDPDLTATVEGLVPGDEFQLKYELEREPGEDAGEYAIKASGNNEQGNYEVSYQNGTFAIEPADIKTATVTAADQTYDGTEKKPDPIVTWNGKTLAEGTDYDVTAYAGNKDAGDATVTVTGKGNFTGTANGTFKIAPAKATITVDNASKVEGESDPVFTGTVEGLIADGDLGEITYSREGSDEAPGTYKGVLTANYTDNPNYDVTVTNGDFTITQKPADTPTYKAVSGSGGTYTKGSGKTLTFTYKRSADDGTTFSHFKGITVDGKAVPEKDSSGKANWTAKSGSVIIELQSSYLETLSVGEHKLAVQFDDGADATSTFTVKAKPATPTVTPTKTPTKAANTSGKATTTAPKTGDESNMLLWFLLICASLFVMFRIISLRNRRFYDR